MIMIITKQCGSFSIGAYRLATRHVSINYCYKCLFFFLIHLLLISWHLYCFILLYCLLFMCRC